MQTARYQNVAGCRLCGGSDLDQIVDLGNQTLGSIFPRPGDPDPPRAPLVLVRCARCGLAQLRGSVARPSLYTYDYGYRSGINATMRAHLRELAGWAQRRVALRAGDIVLDIGCNDGTLLQSFRLPGLRRVGIDVIAGKFSGQMPSDIVLCEAAFSAASWAAACNGERARLVTSVAVFYDIDQPQETVAAIASALAPDGVWIIEQAYLWAMLQRCAYDAICHEHLTYYGLAQIEALAAANGLRVFDAVLTPCNGGSLRLALCHDGAGYRPRQRRLARLRQLEHTASRTSPSPYATFAAKVAKSRDDLLSFIGRKTRCDKRIFAYGASTKGNTLLQYCRLDRSVIAAAAERNPEKVGRRTPGTAIPIVSEETARQKRPDYFLVLPWQFRREFVARESAFRQAGGRLVFPLPTLEIV
ncbi:class I SAM-dependent methyltransferase [Vineibacter terrae]|uniref:class I SAM-dependent methyltransferase n=1 Tax=Vineibacter terrae TaxID=2586908 RepID=UPI002E34AAD3|nr:methyltransferase domain-containing protein [Vineibacter terrae]HEX2885737.1 methyltransferase domain-containing protein [Vineibacter terrae]